MESQHTALELDDHGLEEVIITLKELIAKTEKIIESVKKSENQ